MLSRKWLLDLYLYSVFATGINASMTTLIWDEDSCAFFAKETSPGKSYRIEYNGEKVFDICDELRFRGYDNSFEYEVCVEVEEFAVECGVWLSYWVDLSDKDRPDKQYNCSDHPRDILRFCSPLGTQLYITIAADDKTDSRIVLNVTHGESEGGISDRVWFYLKIAKGVLGFLCLVGLTVYAIRKCRTWVRARRERQDA